MLFLGGHPIAIINLIREGDSELIITIRQIASVKI